MMPALAQALLLIFIGICFPATINLLFDWRRNKRLDQWLKEPRYLPTCASAGTVRPGRRS